MARVMTFEEIAEMARKAEASLKGEMMKERRCSFCSTPIVGPEVPGVDGVSAGWRHLIACKGAPGDVKEHAQSMADLQSIFKRENLTKEEKESVSHEPPRTVEGSKATIAERLKSKPRKRNSKNH